MIRRSLWFLGVCITAATGPIWALCLIGVPYVVYYAGVELLIVAVMIDGYFGYERTIWPVYTLLTLVIIVVVRLLRPYISVYNR